MVNILAKREVVKELIQHTLTPDSLAAEMLRLTGDPSARSALQTDLAKVVATLGEPGAYHRAATIVTSQLPVDTWHDVIGDPTLADAILDRLVHNAHRLELAGDSMRKINARHKKLDREPNP
jgi:hypothetical protein